MKYIGIKLKNGREYPICTHLGMPHISSTNVNLYTNDSTDINDHFRDSCLFFGSKKGLNVLNQRLKSIYRGRVFIAKYDPNNPKCPKLIDKNIEFQSGGLALRLPIHELKFDSNNNS